MMISLFVMSAATNPVTPEMPEFANSVNISVVAAWTIGQLAGGHVTAVPGGGIPLLLKFFASYAAHEYCPNRLRF